MYTDEARHDLDLLSNTWLVDEFEQSLKGMENYRQAMQHLNEVCPSLSEYMEKNLLLLAGDCMANMVLQQEDYMPGLA